MLFMGHYHYICRKGTLNNTAERIVEMVLQQVLMMNQRPIENLYFYMLSYPLKCFLIINKEQIRANFQYVETCILNMCISTYGRLHTSKMLSYNEGQHYFDFTGEKDCCGRGGKGRLFFKVKAG
jgi:hypothetical protein